MNRNLGLIGRKVGNTHFYGDGGKRVAVTVVEAGPCTVVSKRTAAKDGYVALRLAFGEKPERLTTRPERGQYKESKAPPARIIREFRVSEQAAAKFEVGQKITVADVFKKGDTVDICGRSKGRGFAGVIKRHKFNSFVAGHGTHEYFRHSGSIGQNMTPGHVYKGVKMPGHMGDARVTIVGIEVAEVDAAQDLVLIDGSVPGPRHALLTVRISHRRMIKKVQAAAASVSKSSKKK